MSSASGRQRPALPWDDLADHQPGQAVIARADMLYAQWRERSWWGRRTSSRSEEHASRRQAAGQVYVARQLDRLGGEWRTLHQIPAGPLGAGIDHLVVGPGGVFTVNSRHHAQATTWLGGDTLIVNGERVHHIHDSRVEAECASTLLSAAVGFEVPVLGMVVIVGDKRFDVRCQSGDGSVRVTTPKAGVRWLRHQSTEWTDYGIERIFAAARRSTTWTHPVAQTEVDEPREPAVNDRVVPIVDTRYAS